MDEKNRIVSPEQANWTKILIWTCFTAEVNWAQAQDGGGDSVKLVSAYSIVMVCKGGGREGDFVPQGTFSNVWRHFWLLGRGSAGLYQGEAKDAAEHL